MLADRIDMLRRALGVPEPFPVPAHLTLVPPLNVAADDPATGRSAVEDLLRAAAAGAGPLTLRVGPAATFWPDNPTLHLAVTEASGDGALAALRAAVRRGPLGRDDEWPFVAHVTLAESFDPGRIADAVALLAGVDEPWPVTALHLLEQRRRDDGTPVWVPVREEPLGRPVVVGRGGVELELRVLGMVPEDVAALAAVAGSGPLPPPGDPVPLTVVADDRGGPTGGPEGRGPLGAAVGSVVGSLEGGGVARLDAVAVADGRRGEGIGRQLLAAWCSAAVDRGATVALAADPDTLPVDFLTGLGFVPAAGALVRSLH
jgi:2'-5' RNA ligase